MSSPGYFRVALVVLSSAQNFAQRAQLRKISVEGFALEERLCIPLFPF
jgi:hypothetical protein